MLGFLKRDADEVYKNARRQGLVHYEKTRRTLTMLYFKRAAQACPERAGELAQFFYDRKEYKRACYFYDVRLRAGGAERRDYRHAVKAYEKRAAMYQERQAFMKYNRCRGQAMAYRSSIAKYFGGPPPLSDDTVALLQRETGGALGTLDDGLTGMTRRPSILS